MRLLHDFLYESKLFAISTYSLEEEACTDHLIGVLCLLALVYGIGLHLGNISLLLVIVVKSCPLSTGHGQFVLIGDITIDALVLETILAKLVGASVLTTLSCPLVHLLAHANQGRFEFIQGNASILIQIELRHEHLDLFFERRETVGFSKELLNLIGSNRSAAIFIDTTEGRFKLFV